MRNLPLPVVEGALVVFVLCLEGVQIVCGCMHNDYFFRNRLLVRLCPSSLVGTMRSGGDRTTTEKGLTSMPCKSEGFTGMSELQISLSLCASASEVWNAETTGSAPNEGGAAATRPPREVRSRRHVFRSPLANPVRPNECAENCGA